MADGDVQHGGLTPGVSSGIHVVHRWSVADASARSALSLTTVDIGGIARQVDTGDFYILRGVSPAAWQALGSSVVAGDVVGPASAAVGRVATFSNVDGKHIQDSGTLLSSLATTSALTAGDSTALASAQAYTDALATATSSALAAKADASALTAHTSNTSNPHNATAAQVGAVAKAASSTDNAVMRFDLATGGVAQNSPVTIDDSGNVALPALATVDGRDVSVDGAKLDGIAPGATVAPALSSTTPASVAAAGAVGVGSTTARADHAHAHGSQLGGGLHAAAVDSVSDGFMTAAQSAKLTAVEAGAQVTSFTRVQTALAGATGAIAVNAQKITGLADPTSAQDAATRAYVLANAGGATLSNATPADNGTASAGAATTASRGDHAHGHGTLSGGTFHAQATQSVDGFMSAADKLKQDRWSIVRINADVSNSTVSYADATGLAFAVASGVSYRFKFWVVMASASTTTGVVLSLNGPATSQLSYRVSFPITSSGENARSMNSYDFSTTAGATYPAGDNLCVVEGLITPSASGSLIVRFASEVAASAVTVRAGSMGELLVVS